MAAIDDLRGVLQSLLSACPTRQATGPFIDLCYEMALSYLRLKQRRRHLDLGLLGLPLEDLAMDCIAGLFERDAQGRFIELIAYFESVSWRDAGDDALLNSTRRLVFSAVSDRLFACYREVDRSLSNILRSLKRALNAQPGASPLRQGGAVWIQFQPARQAETPVPLMPPEFLEAHLASRIEEGMQTPDVLRAAAEIFLAQDRYARRYPLTLLAQVIRAATVRVTEAVQEPVPAPGPLYERDVSLVIARSVRATQEAMRASYVARGKVDEGTYGLYFRAIKDRLTEQFARRNGHALTNYKALSVHLPHLSREAYGAEHRAIFEYLSTCTREHLTSSMRREV